MAISADFQLDAEVTWEDGVTELLPRLVVLQIVAAALYESGAGHGELIEVGVSFCGPERSAQLNEDHRGVQGATDVLSFPIDGLVEPVPPGMPRVLGDVVICPDYVREQVAAGTTMQPAGPGQEHGDSTVEQALERCVAHGVLHLVGFDHERGREAASEMFLLEQLVLDRVRGSGM